MSHLDSEAKAQPGNFVSATDRVGARRGFASLLAVVFVSERSLWVYLLSLAKSISFVEAPHTTHLKSACLFVSGSFWNCATLWGYYLYVGLPEGWFKF